MAVMQKPSLLCPQLNECRHNPLCPLTPYGQQSCSCFGSGTGDGMKGGDELLGTLMYSEGTGVRITAMFSSCSPGNCGAVPGEVGGQGSRGKVCEGSC